jgi:hypothetical protein
MFRQGTDVIILKSLTRYYVINFEKSMIYTHEIILFYVI